MLFLERRIVAVHRFGPLLLRPKEACQATGLGRVRNGMGQDEDQSGAGGKKSRTASEFLGVGDEIQTLKV